MEQKQYHSSRFKKYDRLAVWTLYVAIFLSVLLIATAIFLAIYFYSHSDDKMKRTVEILAGLFSIVAFTWIIATFLLQWVGINQQGIALQLSHDQIMREVDSLQQESARREDQEVEKRILERAGNVKYLAALICERVIGRNLIKDVEAHIYHDLEGFKRKLSPSAKHSFSEVAPGDGAELLLRLYYQDAPSIEKTEISLLSAIDDVISYEGEWAYDDDGSAKNVALNSVLSFEELIRQFLDEISGVFIEMKNRNLAELDLLTKVLRYDLSLAVVMRMALKDYISNLDNFDTMIWAVLEIDTELDLGYWPQVPADRRSILDQRGEIIGFGAQIARLQSKRNEAIKKKLLLEDSDIPF